MNDEKDEAEKAFWRGYFNQGTIFENSAAQGAEADGQEFAKAYSPQPQAQQEPVDPAGIAITLGFFGVCYFVYQFADGLYRALMYGLGSAFAGILAALATWILLIALRRKTDQQAGDWFLRFWGVNSLLAAPGVIMLVNAFGFTWQSLGNNGNRYTLPPDYALEFSAFVARFVMQPVFGPFLPDGTRAAVASQETGIGGLVVVALFVCSVLGGLALMWRSVAGPHRIAVAVLNAVFIGLAVVWIINGFNR